MRLAGDSAGEFVGGALECASGGDVGHDGDVPGLGWNGAVANDVPTCLWEEEDQGNSVD